MRGDEGKEEEEGKEGGGRGERRGGEERRMGRGLTYPATRRLFGFWFETIGVVISTLR